jgi:hypothetical protein
MKTFSHLWEYLAEFFLEWEMFETKVVEKIKTHIFFQWLFSESRAVYEIMSKNYVEPERPQMAKCRRFACWIIKATRAQKHTHTSAPTLYLPSPPPRTHTHTQVCNTYCFPRQEEFLERGSVLLCLFCPLYLQRMVLPLVGNIAWRKYIQSEWRWVWNYINFL